MVNPTGYTALDLVGFTDKGPYDPNANYVRNDIVSHSGSKWRCKVDDTTGTTPTEGATWTKFIDLSPSDFEQMIAPIEESPSQHSYQYGDRLIYNDVLYKVRLPIAVNDALEVGVNIIASDPLTRDLKNYYNAEDDPAVTTIEDNCYIPFIKSGVGKKKILWQNLKAIIANLFGLGNVTITNPKNGDLLQYSGYGGTGSKWVNSRAIINLINALGARNFLQNNNSTKTESGTTWTVNNDKSVTVSGTPTAASSISFNAPNLPKGEYILSGAGDAVNIKWGAITLLSGNTVVATITVNSAANKTFDTSSYTYDKARVSLLTNTNGTAVSGTIYPMITLVDDRSFWDDPSRPAYLPYSMTNKAITDYLNDHPIPTKVSQLQNDSGFTTNAGTVTSVAGGTGLNGGTITGSGTLSVKYGTAAGTACQGNDSRLSDARTPVSHASTGTGYGIGNASNYGHVKLSDTYTSNVGAAANAIGASQTALFNTYKACGGVLSSSSGFVCQKIGGSCFIYGSVQVSTKMEGTWGDRPLYFGDATINIPKSLGWANFYMIHAQCAGTSLMQAKVDYFDANNGNVHLWIFDSMIHTVAETNQLHIFAIGWY